MNMVKNMQRQQNIHEVKAMDAFCDICSNSHDSSECGQNLESSFYVGNFNRNVMSNTYNPSWRKHPNFSWGRSCYQSQPTTVPDKPAETNTPAEADEDHTNPSKHEEAEVKTEYQYKKFFDILKQVHVNLPLVETLQQMPNYAKFLKDLVSRKTRIREFETAAATEACLAMMHNKVPAKKTDPGSFTIPCSIKNNSLPRPSIGRVMIDFKKGELTLRVDEELVKIKVFIVPGQHDNKEEYKAPHTHEEKCTEKLKSYIEMASSSSNSDDSYSGRFNNAVAHERYYNIVAGKNLWEEQALFFDERLENYGLEVIIHKRLVKLEWFKFSRQLPLAKKNWVREFYAHNPVSENTMVYVRKRWVQGET
ncbi:hypothetical protein GQ457_06G013770 [Hibiscus cannabinus]